MMRLISCQVMKWLAPLGLAVFASACTEMPEPRIAQGQVRDLQFNVVYVTANSNQTEARVSERVRGLVEHIELQFSSEYENSEVNKVNLWRSTEPMVLTRELEAYLTTGVELYLLTQGELSLFSEGGSNSAPIRIQNHQLVKADRNVTLNYDMLLHGFMVDRVAELMELMSVEHYDIEINGQRRVGHVEKRQLQHVAQSATRFAENGTNLVVTHESAAMASALSAWLASMSEQDARATTARLGLPAAIGQGENGAATRYTGQTIQAVSL
ncbi:FAD:protein FMN transferase [Aliidiomarina celeris]|uniref:FAD:protein FMN transferase n=1 Tax=Aliidiomarina celeris TaxID=2249428 RepID=UPI000DEB490B|nr:FAD:protein FMN transferase [Aliidiomarina celeris]